jgi:hypothetical protein
LDLRPEGPGTHDPFWSAGRPIAPPDADKLRRAHAWAAFVEDGTVLFPPEGSEDLIASMLAVPEDESKWDLVDAAGYCLRGFPALEAAHTPVDRDARPKGQERAASYAMRGTGMPLSAAITWEKYSGPRKPDLRRRAQRYAGRRPG